tara:strand:- start:6137 stop:7432 length:1296 start_codon:yes stop_codon:yes gene_type:complete
MAKAYINTVKYQIVVEYEIQGIVDKHDIIGAIFGQSEGLMGEDLDLRELQKNGKIGRIEVTTKTHLGKSTGEVIVPSSMDMVKTSLLAASVEAVDKVGPCDSVFKTVKIEDTRTKKRQVVQERAKELLKQLTAGMPESTELADAIRNDVRTAAIEEYGREKLPAGPDVKTSDEIVIVEGRADVINLLKHGIKNCVAIDGANIPASIVELSKKKTVTIFADGDRGGDLIARKLMDLTPIAFVAKAPDGKEVEELAGKEIIVALKKRIDAKEFIRRVTSSTRPRAASSGRPRPSLRASSRTTHERKPHRTEVPGRYSKPSGRTYSKPREQEPRSYAPLKPKQGLGEFEPLLTELNNSLKARLYGKGMKLVKEVDVRTLLDTMGTTKGLETIVFDGIVTKRLLDQAEKSGVKTLVGIKKGRIEETGKVKVLTAA